VMAHDDYIFLIIFCSNILHTFVFYMIVVQTSDPYISKVHISVLCSFNLIVVLLTMLEMQGH